MDENGLRAAFHLRVSKSNTRKSSKMLIISAFCQENFLIKKPQPASAIFDAIEIIGIAFWRKILSCCKLCSWKYVYLC